MTSLRMNFTKDDSVGSPGRTWVFKKENKNYRIMTKNGKKKSSMERTIQRIQDIYELTWSSDQSPRSA